MLNDPAQNDPADIVPAVNSGVFVSDLHLFSPRSAADRVHRQLSEFCNADQCIVLGGDIFDFRWSDRGSRQETLQAAREWLEELLVGTGNSQVLFLPGNHDCDAEFLLGLSQLAAKEPRFHCYDHHAQIGDSLFLHGDILDAKGAVQGLSAYRSKFQHAHPQPQISHRAYDLAVGMRVHKLVPLLRHPPQLTCQRLWDMIQTLPLERDLKVQRVFFGHTHVPIHGLELAEVEFYNPGASLRHMQSHFQRFDFDAPTKLADRTPPAHA
jgi:DNA repair exonuclease SbcCD nuclease subunit